MVSRSREYLTPAEVERLISAAKNRRWGLRDAYPVMVAYRHGLRAGIVCAKVELSSWQLGDVMSENHKSIVHEINRRWVDQNPNGHRDWRAIARAIGPRINDDCICRILVDQLLHEKYFLPIFIYLERELSALGMEFYSPGGSVQRQVWVMLGELFGVGDAPQYSAYIEHSTVRVGLDILANEIAKRCVNARGAS